MLFVSVETTRRSAAESYKTTASTLASSFSLQAHSPCSGILSCRRDAAIPISIASGSVQPTYPRMTIPLANYLESNCAFSPNWKLSRLFGFDKLSERQFLGVVNQEADDWLVSFSWVTVFHCGKKFPASSRSFRLVVRIRRLSCKHIRVCVDECCYYNSH